MSLSPDVEQRLSLLRSDFEEVSGMPFETFFCPITFRDERVEVCRGHIVPQAFPDSDRTWTIQRKDVDSFYGSTIEADYVALRHKGQRSALEGLKDRSLQRELQPKVRLEGREVDFYRPSGSVPPQHTPVRVGPQHDAVQLALKMEPSEVLAAAGRRWELGFERDLRVPVLATALKSAHLTLFHIVGYRYALSAAGHFVGSEILGEFYDQNAGKSRADATAAARRHFSQFSNIVRPLEACPEFFRGTVSDRRLYLCKTPAWPWAFMVFVRTGSFMHAVMLPCFDDDHAIARYLKFLDGDAQEFEAYLTEFDGNQWNVSTEPDFFRWPDSRFDEGMPGGPEKAPSGG